MLIKLFISTALIPITYLLIALILTYLPFNRNLPEESIDFDVLNPALINQELFIERYYSARDGKELFYRYLKGSTDKILILLHGSGSEGRYLLRLAEKLRDAVGLNVVIPDLRGHGRSSLLNLGDIDYLGQYEHDLEDLNRHLRDNFPDASIALGGHSSGAGLALKYGGKQGLAFDRYLFLAPYLGYNAPTVKPDSGGWVQVALRRYIGLTMFNRAGITRFNHLPVLYFNRPEAWNDVLQADSYSYRLNESFSPQAYGQDLEDNHKPMLVLIGSDDDSFYPENFAPIFAEYAPNAKVHLVPGSKHLDLPDSEESLRLISEWLK